ncbi:Adenosine kinase 2 [Portunus trituberculatus]|uniref:Adenosine kinase n=1 Tax=Portunus trituberculatus TaxID=210409 RepID=A0A5B7IV93_PORTR|nr:Adenosine kinase 2 [Portunus trituberculatus]
MLCPQGFFLTVSPETIQTIGKHACEHNKVFSMNLSAPFLCEFYKEPMMAAFPYIDILFSNETVSEHSYQEAAKFSEVQGFGLTDIREIALKAASLPKENKKRSRIVVFTQGADNIILAKDGKVKEFPVVRLPEEKLIDTNGAGDAFVGGECVCVCVYVCVCVCVCVCVYVCMCVCIYLVVFT